MSTSRKPNQLINESSPYLLQHAYNPVNWLPWGDEALSRAKSENKLMIISVGYSACHWCHVMEHQSFEDEKVAQIMNDLFISIKVDREERPDIDQVYMAAVQLMTGQGGWPLNCIALPDGRPLYGGTYFPKEKWMAVLLNLADLWNGEPEKCIQYATQLTDGVRALDQLVPEFDTLQLSPGAVQLSWENWSQRIDTTEGGPNRAPKFPLPVNYLFLLRYSHYSKSGSARQHTLLTLDKMAMGGIYDHVGGGFARYSTDMLWKVPHFEKMLYDNAQLISLYSEAYGATGDVFYQNVVKETIAWAERELLTDEGGFCSALDADSEGEEGKFYVWKKEELMQELQSDFEWFAELFNVNSIGYWVDHHQNQNEGNYILLMRQSYSSFAKSKGWTTDELMNRVGRAKMQLLAARSKRVRPGLDDKMLCSWNAMMIKAYAEAWKYCGDDTYLLSAIKTARFIKEKMTSDKGRLWHSWKNGKASVNGFLEDYAFVIDAYIALYQTKFDEAWLMLARELANTVIELFSDSADPMFFFTSSEDAPLIARKKELSDNVIPASNSVMANNLSVLGRYFGREEWIMRASEMLKCVEAEMIKYGAGYANWLNLALHQMYPSREVVIVGKHVDKSAAELRKYYLPNEIFAGSAGHSEIPLLHNRTESGKDLIFVCENNTCHLPVSSVEEALKQLN
ncbi:MAG: thioredoxin domain-containing protein [Bacteroidia bacterium]|nr:thioredoxin domain-containing protein [Bacteroidia bacterium]